jgi:hypothetical protein
MDGRTAILIMMLALIVGGFAAFVSFCPVDFFVASSKPGLTPINYPAYWTKEDIQNLPYQETQNITIGTLANWFESASITPYSFCLQWVSWGSINIKRMTWIYITHTWFNWVQESVNTYQNFEFKKEEALLHLTDTNVSRNRLFDTNFEGVLFIMDTNFARHDVETAWNEGQLQIQIAFGTQNSTNADPWQLMGKILTFQAPEIFGSGAVGLFLNALIAIPIWALTISLVAIIIFEIIPF